jgi:hypothetical protein
MQRSGWKETIKPSPMAEDYEVQTEMLSGTARLTPRMPRSPNVTIWFCSWSITRHKVTLCKSDGQGFIRTSRQRCRQKGLRMADHAQNKGRPNTIICIDAHHRVRSSAMNLLFVCSRNRRRILTAEACSLAFEATLCNRQGPALTQTRQCRQTSLNGRTLSLQWKL